MYIYNPQKQDEKVTPLQIGYKAYNLCYYKMKNTPWFVVVKPNAFSLSKIKQEALKKLYPLLDKNKKYAIRSSGTVEDTKEYSLAGAYETILNVTVTDLEESINKCYASITSPQALAYYEACKIDKDNVTLAIIIQEMIEPDFSGVINTINPLTNDPDMILISVCKGYGEALVSGKVSSTDYFVSPNKTEIKGSDLLGPKLLTKVIKFTKTLKSLSNTFLDIEFCIKKGKVYFLQARPITPYGHLNTKDKITILDNSNIVESYSHTTTPLTGSFAKSMYKGVYTKTLELANIDQKTINKLSFALNNMVCFYQNRLYYNLNSWYTLNSLFPVKSSNESMEQMMGLKTASSVKPVKLSIFKTLQIGIIFLKKLKQLPKDSDNFIKKFDEIVKPYILNDFNDYTMEQLKAYYEQLEHDIMDEFTIPVINDCACMFSTFFLKRSLKKHHFENPDELISNITAKQGNVISSKAPLYLQKIIDLIKTNETILNDFKKEDEQTLLNNYLHHPLLEQAINDYLITYGSRVSNELKLETITMTCDKTILFKLLKDYINYDVKLKEEELIHIELPKHLTKKSEKMKYYIRNRERLRMLRTYVFDVIRKLFIRIGEIFKGLNIIEDAKDIFYLEVEEIFNIIEQRNYQNQFALIKKRKETFKNYSSYSLPKRIVLYGDQPLYVKDSNPNLQGIGSGCGKVTGEIININTPDPVKCANKIVCTYQTDPGWTVVLPLIKGLLVERGSILSHSSVVSRELGVPSIVGLEGITKKFNDGDIVVLDSNKGIVEKEHEK